jgi:hypothetical protein
MTSKCSGCLKGATVQDSDSPAALTEPAGNPGMISNYTTSLKPNCRPIRLVADISAACFRQKRVKELALYYCLQALDISGQGNFVLEDMLGKLKAVFNYSPKTVYSYLSLGEGIFWVKHVCYGHTRVVLRSRSNICLSLNLEKWTNSHFSELDPTDFDRPDKRKAQIYASIHHPAGTALHPRSRAYIEQFTGLTRSRQRRLEKIAHVKRVANFEVRYDEKLHKCVPVTMEVTSYNKSDPSKSRTSTIAKRMGNSYIAQQSPGPHGSLKKVAKLIRSLKRDEAAQPVKQLYFNIFNGLVKCLAHRRIGTEGLARVTPKRAVYRGRSEWSRIAVELTSC